MPSLIRFFITILILAGLVYGAMFALTIFVKPQEKEEIVRIPSKDLFQKP